MASHILNISFDFDSEAIKRTVEAQAARQIIEDIKGDIEETMFYHRWGSDQKKPQGREGLASFVLERFDDFIKENKETIINIAVEEAIKRLVRTKVVNDTADKIIREVSSK